MNDGKPYKVILGEFETNAVCMPDVESVSTCIGEAESVVVTRETLTAKVNRGVGYIYGGIVYIIRNTFFFHRRVTKQGHTRITKGGANRITSREIT